MGGLFENRVVFLWTGSRSGGLPVAVTLALEHTLEPLLFLIEVDVILRGFNLLVRHCGDNARASDTKRRYGGRLGGGRGGGARGWTAQTEVASCANGR